MKTRDWLAMAAIGMAMSGAGRAQGVPMVPLGVGPTTLTVVAEGRVARAPDLAEVSGGVVTTAATASAAMRDNAEKMTAVVAAIRKAGLAERDIQTSGLNLAPQYRYVDNQPPVLTGYQATNTVSLRIRRIADTGKLLDTLVGVGANQISGPTFRIDAADAALDEARVSAVTTAKARAELYAKASGLRVKRIASIAESGGIEPGPRPMMMTARSEKAADSTPVAAGEVALTINVTMVFEME